MERLVLRASPVSKNRSRGFTLVELAVVVTIVAVLAVIALVGYRKYMLNSHITEAQSVISAIKIAQEDHKSEKGTYQAVGQSNWCPMNNGTGGTSTQKWGWDPTCNGGSTQWNTLAVHVEGPVQFGYITWADVNSKAVGYPTADTSFVTFPSTSQPAWYTITAKADLDPGGNATTLVGSSLDNRIFTNYAGE